MNCHSCGYALGGHDAACPESAPKDRGLARRWRHGWNDGHAGKPVADADPSYKLGYHRGEIAQEEAANGAQ